MLRYLIKECGVDVEQADNDGDGIMSIAASNGHINVMRFMVTECGADVNQTDIDGSTVLLVAVAENDVKITLVDMIRYLVKKLGADVNRSNLYGVVPLMAAAQNKDTVLIKHLVHKGAFVRAVSKNGAMAITMLKAAGASAEQIAYLEVRACCANQGCGGGGVKRCAVCKETRYCEKQCQVAHWSVHRVSCRQPL
jgi:ankyrin repeat protein